MSILRVRDSAQIDVDEAATILLYFSDSQSHNRRNIAIILNAAAFHVKGGGNAQVIRPWCEADSRVRVVLHRPFIRAEATIVAFYGSVAVVIQYNNL